MIGTTLSHYRITDQLGRGGMGIVYKAEDTKLDRTVALKLLPPQALASEDDRARFHREAKAAAALHHPNIATIFGIDDAVTESGDTQPFIAMEFVDGETLAERITRGPLPLKDAISIATQIADGLRAAHEKGIVHRDIKSGNVMLTKDGTAKILDFGLAMTAASTRLTQMGSTLGTVAYMSPEQAKGEEVDRRSDVWSLGVILYEMITGQLPFKGDYEQAIIYGILNEDPDSMTSLRAGVPMVLDAVIAKLLAKDPQLRYQHVDELPADLKAIDLSATAQTSRISTTTVGARPAFAHMGKTADAPAAVTSSNRIRRDLLLAALALIIGICAGAAGLYLLRSESPDSEQSLKRLSLTIPVEDRVTALDITPDGSALVFTTAMDKPIRVMNLGDRSMRTLDGTEGTLVVRVSPDGGWVMMTMASGVKRVSLYGGKPITVVEATTEPGPYTAWAPGDRLVYEDNGKLWIKTIVGGNPLPLTDHEEGEVDHDWPFVLPDGKTMIATIEYAGGSTGIGMWDLDSRERIGTLEIGGYAPRWIATGHLIYQLDGELTGVPFDVSRLEITGVPVSLESSVDARTFSVSSGGTFVSLEAADPTVLGTRTSVINRMDFDGERRTLPFDAQNYWDLRLSPDGTRLALEVEDGSGARAVTEVQDIWVLDVEDGYRERLTFDNSGDEATWSPDGDSLLYVERGSGQRTVWTGSRLLVRSADATGSPRVIYTDSVRIEYPDWSRDGRYVVFSRSNAGTQGVASRAAMPDEIGIFASVVVLDTETGTLRTIEDRATRGRISPDGRYVAYEHRNHIFVKPMSLDGGVWDVSDGAGRDPHWSRDGRRLYFLRDSELMRVEVAPAGGRVRFGNAELAVQLDRALVSYSVAADDRGIYYTGLRTTAAEADEEEAEPVVPPVNVVINWFEHIRRLSPGR